MVLAGSRSANSRQLKELTSRRDTAVEARKQIFSEIRDLLSQAGALSTPSTHGALRKHLKEFDGRRTPLGSNGVRIGRQLKDRLSSADEEIDRVTAEVRQLRAFERAVGDMKSCCLTYLTHADGTTNTIDREIFLAARVKSRLSRFSKADRDNIVRRACREIMILSPSIRRDFNPAHLAAILDARRKRAIAKRQVEEASKDALAALARLNRDNAIAAAKRLGAIQRNKLNARAMSPPAAGGSSARPSTFEPRRPKLKSE